MSRKRQPTTIVNLHYSPDAPLLPDGKPLPDVCTAEEVMLFLRLTEPTTDNKPRHRALDSLRERRVLVGFKCGRFVLYTKKAVLECLDLLQREAV
jgi:hypothetical protein